MLSEGHYFFTDIEKEGILLYDSGHTSLAERKPLSPAEAQVIAREYYDQWFKEGTDFLEATKFSLQRDALKVGAFTLHQATERTYNAIVLVFTGYKPKTHNLDKLKRYTKRFSEELAAVFPENTAEEERLFDLLKRAYIDARYKKDYVITAEELDTLIERVQKLQHIVRPLCVEKIALIGEM